LLVILEHTNFFCEGTLQELLVSKLRRDRRADFGAGGSSSAPREGFAGAFFPFCAKGGNGLW
jgi:hypothetical protein